MRGLTVRSMGSDECARSCSSRRDDRSMRSRFRGPAAGSTGARPLSEGRRARAQAETAGFRPTRSSRVRGAQTLACRASEASPMEGAGSLQAQPVHVRDTGTVTNSSVSGWSGRGFSLHHAARPLASSTRPRNR